MEPGSDFEQTGGLPLDLDPPLARFRDAGQDLQECALACAVAADYAENLAALDFEVNVLECPKLLFPLGSNRRSSAEQIGRRAGEALGFAGDHVAQGCVALMLRLVVDNIFLAETLGTDYDVGHVT